jgi:hypothetical protein
MKNSRETVLELMGKRLLKIRQKILYPFYLYNVGKREKTKN